MKSNSIIPWGCVFKVTFPNGKIYIGSDTALNAKIDFFKYFGSPKKGKNDMYNDLKEYIDQKIPYKVQKEILYAAENLKIGDILKAEQYYIKYFNSKDPCIGYNR